MISGESGRPSEDKQRRRGIKYSLHCSSGRLLIFTTKKSHSNCQEGHFWKLPEYGEALTRRVGKSFVHSLFSCAGEIWIYCRMSHSMQKRDIGWWKVIFIASMLDPYSISASISHLRKNIDIDCYLITDASSTSIGINGKPIDINVLEYFAVVYFIMMAGMV